MSIFRKWYWRGAVALVAAIAFGWLYYLPWADRLLTTIYDLLGGAKSM